MSMRGIANYMHLSHVLDLKRNSESVLKLPKGATFRTVLMPEKKVATFSAVCSHRAMSRNGVV